MKNIGYEESDAAYVFSVIGITNTIGMVRNITSLCMFKIISRIVCKEK